MSKTVRVLLVKDKPYVAEYVASRDVEDDAELEQLKELLKRVRFEKEAKP